jgi:hypothetical protein
MRRSTVRPGVLVAHPWDLQAWNTTDPRNVFLDCVADLCLGAWGLRVEGVMVDEDSDEVFGSGAVLFEKA